MLKVGLDTVVIAIDIDSLPQPGKEPRLGPCSA